MKTVTGIVVSSNPISLSKAASTLSSFLSADNGASKAICAYLRRASSSFNELKQLHKDLKSSRSDRNHRHHRSEVSNDLQAAVESEKIKSPVSESKRRIKQRENRGRTEDEQDGKTATASGEFAGEIGKRARDELKIEVESSDRDKSVVAVEKKKKKHKKKSEDGHGKGGEDVREAEAKQSYGKSQISANNGEVEATGYLVDNNVAKDLVELSTTKKKNKKKRMDEDADELRNNNGGTIEKDEMSVSVSKESKRKEKKKRKNREFEEQGDGVGSEEQQGTKRRKRSLSD